MKTNCQWAFSVEGIKLILTGLALAAGAMLAQPVLATGTADIAVRDLVYLPVNVTNLSPAGTVSCRVQNYGPDALTVNNGGGVQFDFYMVAPDSNAVWMGGFPRLINLAVNEEALIILTAAERQGVTIPSGLLGKYRPEVTVRYLAAINDPIPANNTALGVGLVTVKANGLNSIGRSINDYDGDGRSDLALYNVGQGVWSVAFSGMRYTQFSRQFTRLSNWQGVPGDYDGDGLCDVGLYDYASGDWRMELSSNHYLFGAHCSDPPIVPVLDIATMPDYVPVPVDFDGDGKTDPLVYRDTDGYWLGIGSVHTFLYGAWWCGVAHKPVPADYDGDRWADLMVYSESIGQWFGGLSSAGYQLISGGYGGPGFMAVPADYDGDGRVDFALYEYATGCWYVLMSNRSSGPTGQGYSEAQCQLGTPNGMPVVADYDGDGLADPAVYHIDTGLWQIYLSSQGYALLSGGYGGPEYQPVSE